MIRSLYRSRDGQVKADLTSAEMHTALQDAEGLLWLDLAAEPKELCEPILRETFGFHPLAVDDALEEAHAPKVDDWGSYLCIVLHAVAFDPGRRSEEPLSTLELDLFLGNNYLVTYRSQPIAAVDRVWLACGRDDRHLHRDSAHLLYLLADELVADYMPVVDAIDGSIDQIEDQVFRNPRATVLEQIFTLRRGLLRLRRIISPQREVLNKLARGDLPAIDSGSRIFFRDVYDHLVRLYDITEGLRELVGSALDTYLSVVSNRMNDVMKTLTVITTLFMPVSFLAGFFGMNFFQPVASMEAWTSRPAFVLMLAAILLVPAGMVLWMRKRAWM
jgi:magnesium transporter